MYRVTTLTSRCRSGILLSSVEVAERSEKGRQGLQRDSADFRARAREDRRNRSVLCWGYFLDRVRTAVTSRRWQRRSSFLSSVSFWYQIVRNDHSDTCDRPHCTPRSTRRESNDAIPLESRRSTRSRRPTRRLECSVDGSRRNDLYAKEGAKLQDLPAFRSLSRFR